MLLAFGFYLGKLLWPFHLSAFIHDLPASIPHLFLSLCLMGGLILLTVYGYLRRQGLWFLGGGWIFLTLFPSVLISLTDVPTPVAERYLYIPSVGLVLLVGSGVRSLLNRKGMVSFVDRVPRWLPLVFTTGLVCVVLGGFALLTWVRLPVWKNNLTFWRDAAQRNPTVWLPHQNLGLVFSDLAMFQQAEEEFQIALELTQGRREWSSTMTSLGIAYMGLGKSREAEKTLLESLKSGVESPFLYYALGYLYTHEKERQRDDPEQMERRFDLARSYFQKAIALNPYYTQAYLQLGDLEVQRGNDDEAGAAFEGVLGLASGVSSPMMEKAQGRLAGIHFRRGNRLFNNQQIERALEEYRQSLGYNPRFAEAHFNLAVGLSTLGRSGEAIGEYRMAIQENPHHAKAHFNLARLLEKEGRVEEARGEYNAFLTGGEGGERFRREAEERLRGLPQER
jgi:tetratricopeptide (TPR) repeat protein